MEKQNKKIFSVLLMAVGVLFISVSGGIFVSRTWQYIPEEIKKMLLLSVTGLFYAGAIKAEKKGNLKITSTALFYLAVFFSGFSTLSVLSLFELSAFAKWTSAQLVMMLPVVFHFVKHQSMLDYVFQMLLMDGSIITWTGFNIISKDDNFLLSFALVSLMLALAIRYAKKKILDNTSFIVTGIIWYGIHAAMFLIGALINACITKDPFFLGVSLLLFVGSVTVIYVTFDHTALRVLQSLSILYSLFLMSLSIGVTLNIEDDLISYIFFLPFVAGILLQVVLRRTEIFWTNLILALFYSMIQSTTCLWFKSYGFSEYPLPYAAVTALMLFIWMYVKDVENKKSYLRSILILLGVQANLMLAYFFDPFRENYCIYLFFALAVLIPTVFIEEDKDICGILYSLSWIFTALGLSNTPVISVNNDNFNFLYEYRWAIFSITVVLLTFIWYHRRDVLQRTQSIFVAVMVISLLLHNFKVQEIQNLMFFGIITLLMFLLSVLKKNKTCSVITAASLMLVVIYMTREFWTSIAWWVYLFIAGIALILFAIKKEKSAEKE